ncbi:MAG: long-chain fatty acid--CoA ligase [Myxococcota bacterium]|jgi:fatty-acyl-CoA synthase|nr:long-chain fatty acid--CoA ligase [Myxococcota bacterium]
MESSFDISRWTWANARWRPDCPALVAGARTLTYRQLEDRVARLTAALQGLGVQPGDRVALLLGNRVELVELVLATARLGALAVPLNHRLTARELAFMLRDCAATILFGDPDLRTLVAKLRAEPQPVTRWLEAGRDTEALLAEAAAGLPPGLPAAAVDAHTPHLILYTAGTTGLPKGVVLTHGNTFWQTMNATALGLLPGTVGLALLPLFHVGGLLGSVLPVLFIGGTVVLQARFDAGETLRLIQAHKVQGMVAVPAIYQFLAAHPDFATTDLSSLVVLTSGGAPLPLHTIEVYRQRGVLFRQGYGLTEAAAGVTGMDPQDCFTHAGTVGKAVHFVSLRIVDDQGADVPPGARGELWVRGPNVMAGYWNRPEETAKVLVDGWLRTGDAASRDEAGYVTIYGRQKEMIISGGENIYPAELENALAEHAGVAEATVFGVPDATWGQRPVAFVAARPGQVLTAAELVAFLEERLARFKLPREFHLVPALPRSAAGKVLQDELRKLLSQ